MAIAWLRSRWTKKEDYEAQLAAVRIDIDRRNAQLAQIRHRQRRASLALTLYAAAAWLLYVFLWHFHLLPNVSSSPLEKVLKSVLPFAGPFLVLFARSIVQFWYTRKGNSEEAQLRALVLKQRKLIDEIKQKTNFYATRDLIDRYDLPSNPPSISATPAALRRVVPQTPTPIRSPQALNPLGSKIPGHAALPSTPTPAAPAKRQWYDRLADVVLGEDDYASPQGSPAATRFALICQNCFAHNGLVRESEWANTQYRCPKCDFFNPAPKDRDKRTGMAREVEKESEEKSGPTPTQSPTPTRAMALPPPISEETTTMEVDSDVESS